MSIYPLRVFVKSRAHPVCVQSILFCAQMQRKQPGAKKAVKPDHDLTVFIMLLADAVLSFAVNYGSKDPCNGSNQQDDPHKHIAVIACLRGYGMARRASVRIRIARSCRCCLPRSRLPHFKRCAAFTVDIDKCNPMGTNRKCAEILCLQRYNRGTGNRCVIACIDQRIIYLEACEFIEIPIPLGRSFCPTIREPPFCNFEPPVNAERMYRFGYPISIRQFSL